MSPQAGPPTGTPQLSPDHKWIWDGTQWHPIAVHEAAFPEWKAVGSDLPAGPPQAVPAPVERRAAPAAYTPVTPAPAQVTPLWEPGRRSTGINKYLYVAGGAVVLLVAAIYLSSINPVALPWYRAPAGYSVPSPTPKLSERSDFVRADRFVNQVLAPPLSELSQSMLLVKQICYGALTSSCEDALIGEENQIPIVSKVLQKETVPLCIAPPVTKMKADLATAASAIQAGKKAYTDNRSSELGAALGAVRGANGAIEADAAAMTAAAKTCDAQVTGP